MKEQEGLATLRFVMSSIGLRRYTESIAGRFVDKSGRKYRVEDIGLRGEDVVLKVVYGNNQRKSLILPEHYEDNVIVP